MNFWMDLSLSRVCYNTGFGRSREELVWKMCGAFRGISDGRSWWVVSVFWVSKVIV